MAKSEGGGGLMSSAGLVRYFESEDRNAIRLDPKTVVAWGALFGFLMQVLNAVGVTGKGIGTTILAIVVAMFGGITVGMIVRAALQGEV